MAAEYAPDQLVDDAAAAVELLEALLDADCAVLVKGSRAAGLEAVAEGLQSRSAVTGGGG
jgi:UDP-N-acetylmuramyl pentapeptide synthase